MIHLYDGNNVMRRDMEKPMAQLLRARPMTLRQRYEATCQTAPGTEIWCWDGYNHNARRRALYPQYKMNREPTPVDIFAQIKLWREILEHSPAVQIEVEGWEADDVIATFARKYAALGVPVTIHSNDMDFAQLEDLPGIILDGVDTKGVPARWVPLYKAMVGDKADNISGIPNFGPKSWEALEDHWPQIERAIVAGQLGGFVGLPFKPNILAWLTTEENVRTLQNMLTITYFENVPDEQLNSALRFGFSNRAAAHKRLKEFFL